MPKLICWHSRVLSGSGSEYVPQLSPPPPPKVAIGEHYMQFILIFNWLQVIEMRNVDGRLAEMIYQERRIQKRRALR